MAEETKPTTATSQSAAASDCSLASVADLLSRIPKSWHDAKIAIGCSEDSAFAVKSVALHQDGNGRKVVVISAEPMRVRSK